MSRQLRCIINDNGPRRRSRASYARRKSHEYKKILYQRATDSVRFGVSPLPVLAKRSDRRATNSSFPFIPFCNVYDRRLATMARQTTTRGEKETRTRDPCCNRFWWRHDRCRANRSSIGKESCTAKSESHCEPGSASQVT